MYASGITFTGNAPAPVGPTVLIDANNGLSLSKIDANTAVLGQDLTDPNPLASLLSDRLIPLNGHLINFQGLLEGNINIEDAHIRALAVGRSFEMSLLNAGAAAFIILRDTATQTASVLLQTSTGNSRIEQFHDFFQITDSTGNPAHAKFVFDTINRFFGIINGSIPFNGALWQVAGPSTSGVLIKPETNNVSVDDSSMIGEFFTNEGSTGLINFNLPAASPGLRYKWLVQVANTMRMTATNGNTIQFAGIKSAANGTAQSAVIGNYVELVAINANEWFGVGIVGVVGVEWIVT